MAITQQKFETIADKSAASMWYYPATKIVHHEIHGFFAGKEFRDFLLAGTEAIRKHHATKWLSDDRKSPVLSQEDTEWGKDNWFVPTLKAGWKHWAIVKPEKAVGKMVMDRLVADYAAAGINAKFFTDPDEAYRWLSAQP
jgi:hypothetical protein